MDNKYTKFKNIYLIVITVITAAAIIFGCYSNLGGHRSLLSFGGDHDFVSTARSSSAPISEDFDCIDIDADIADISIEYGPEAAFAYQYVDYDAPTMSVKDGTLYVKENTKASVSTDTDASSCKIIITIPESKELDDVNINVSAGNIEYSDIICGDLSIDSDFGAIRLSDITCADLDVKADCGDISFVDSVMEDVTVQADLGSIDFDSDVFDGGEMTADTGSIKVSGDFDSLKASCDVGSINVDTIRSEDDLDLDLDATLGSVTVNGRSWN